MESLFSNITECFNFDGTYMPINLTQTIVHVGNEDIQNNLLKFLNFMIFTNNVIFSKHKSVEHIDVVVACKLCFRGRGRH